MDALPGSSQVSRTWVSPASAANGSGAAGLATTVTGWESDSVEPALLTARTRKA